MAGAALLFLFVLAATASLSPTFGLLRYRARSRPVLVPGLDRITRRDASMVRQGLITLSPKPAAPLTLAADTKDAVGLMGVPISEPDATRLAGDITPSTALLPPPSENIPPGVTVLSIVCDSDDLFGPVHGIVTHPHDRGHDSERLAWISARTGNDLVLESQFGLRIHGGDTRNDLSKSFAIMFREEYSGYATSPEGLFFGPDTPPAHRIVLLSATNPARCLGALALDIAARLGCKTSRRVTAVVYINGTRARTPFFLYEHQSPEFIKERYALEDIDWVRLKSSTWLQQKHEPGMTNPHDTNGTPPPADGKSAEHTAFAALEKWLRHVPAPLPFNEAASRYNMADLCNWVLAIAFTGCFDNDQGGYFRDRRNPNAVWQSLVWDMDGAFGRGFAGDAARNEAAFKNPFDEPLLRFGFRVKLFKRLVAESPEFRDYFRHHVREALETKLPHDTLMAMVDEHIALTRSLPDVSPQLRAKLDQAKAFLSTRHDWFLAYLDQRMAAAASRQMATMPKESSATSDER